MIVLLHCPGYPPEYYAALWPEIEMKSETVTKEYIENTCLIDRLIPSPSKSHYATYITIATTLNNILFHIRPISY